jgi:hypothetical protein
VAISAPSLALLERPGHDTLTELLSLRVWTSDLLHVGDWPVWYPYTRYGFPQTTLHLFSSVFSPLGLVLGRLFHYDVWTLTLEFALWRAIGLAGAYVFARRHVRSSLGAAVVAVCFVGSGVVAVSQFMRTIFPGLMVAPWIVAGIDTMLFERDWRRWARGVGLTALAGSALLWNGYPGTWLTLPFLLAPYVVLNALRSRRQAWRTLLGIVAAAALCAGSVALWISETAAFPLFGAGARNAASPMEGALFVQSLLGLWLPNPTYVPNVSLATVQPLYFGFLPALALCAACAPRARWRVWRRLRPLVLALGGLAIAVGLDPGYCRVGQQAVLASTGAVLLGAAAFPRSLGRWERLDVALLLTLAWTVVLATRNPFSDALRLHVAPFSVVRWNWQYAWVFMLLAPLAAWRATEQFVAVHALPHRSAGARIRRWAPGLIATLGLTACVWLLALSQLVAHPPASPDSLDPQPGQTIGAVLAAHQAVLLVAGLGLLCAAAVPRVAQRLHRPLWLLAAVLLLGTLAAGWSLAGRESLIRAGIAVPPGSRQAFDAAQQAIVVAVVTAIALRARSWDAVLRGAAVVVAFDVCVATARYLSDSPLRFTYQGPPSLAHPLDFAFQGPARVPAQAEAPLQADILAATPQKVPATWVWSEFVPQIARFDAEVGPPSVFRTFGLFPSRWAPGTLPGDVSVAPDVLRAAAAASSAPSAGGNEPSACAGGAAPGEAGRGVPLPAATVTQLLSSRVRLRVDADCERLLVYTDTWSPDWRVAVDGRPRPVLRVDGAVRGVIVPAGTHDVEWVYVPRGRAPLLAIMAASFATAGLLLCLPLAKNRDP